MNRFIMIFSFLVFIGCTSFDITPEKPKENGVKETFKNYEIKDNEILFYSKDEKVIKRLDLISRTEEEFDDHGRVFSSKNIPSGYEKILKNNTSIQKIENSFGENGLIKRSNVFLYGFLDNSILYDYDPILRLVSEKYFDSNENLYTKKVYRYNNNYRIIEKKIFDAKGALLEEEVFSYSGGALVKIDTLSGDGKILSTRNFSYDQSGTLKEETFISGKVSIRSLYEKDSFGRTGRILEYSSGVYRGEYKITYDSKGRITERKFYGPNKTIISKEIYKY